MSHSTCSKLSLLGLVLHHHTAGVPRLRYLVLADVVDLKDQVPDVTVVADSEGDVLREDESIGVK